MLLLGHLLLVALGFASIGKSQTVTISPSSTVPSGASAIVKNNFVALGIELASFVDFAGAPVVIRIGGTSSDYSTFDASQSEPIILPPGLTLNQLHHPILGVTLGPSFFDSFKNLPGQSFTWQLQFASSTESLSANALAQAEAAVSGIGLASLASLELGNEPDLYVSPGRRPKGWGEKDYVRQSLEYIGNLQGNISGLPKQGYQALALSSGNIFTIWNESNAEVDELYTNGNIKTVSFHHYQTSATVNSRLDSDLLNHNNIVAGLQQFIPPIGHVRALSPTTEFVLGEVASSFNPGNQDYVFEGVFGDALWTNVGRVHLQQGNGFGYDGWQPIDELGTELETPHTCAPYYRYVYVADFIGTSTSLQVSNIDLSSEYLSTYAGYESGKLAKVAIINLNAWNSTETGTRPVQNFNLNVGAEVSSVTVQFLTAPGADVWAQDGGVTWAGYKWRWDTNLGEGFLAVDNTITVNVVNGVAVVSVQASEAILVTL